MHRRHFLKLTASGSVALGLPGVTGLFQDASRLYTLAHPDLLTILGNEQQVRDVGRAYRKRCPAENDPETLVEAITMDGTRRTVPAGPTLHAYLDQRIRDEFASGRTIQVNGWVLALTEARQSALYSLLYA